MMKPARPNVICIMGPTATGKTKLALALSDYLPVEAISVDSAMVYKGIDIGTAKPTAAELKKLPHHLIDILDPAQRYSAGQFCNDVVPLIEQIHQRGKIPLLVGGTMLYYSLLQKGFTDFPDSDLSVRQQLDARAAQEGWQALYQQLQQVDPVAAQKIHANDKQRIQRALELFFATGKSKTTLQQQQQWLEPPFNFINLILQPAERKILHARIEQRVVTMLSQGLVNEVTALYQRGDLDATLPSIRSVGYRQVWQFLDGQIAEADLKYKITVATRQFAKRQYTWLRQFSGAHFDSESADLTSAVVNFLEVDS